jgi:hypothetical protein
MGEGAFQSLFLDGKFRDILSAFLVQVNKRYAEPTMSVLELPLMDDSSLGTDNFILDPESDLDLLVRGRKSTRQLEEDPAL